MVAFSAASSSPTTNAGTSPLTWTHTCGASDTALYISVNVGHTGATDSSLTAGVTATYNGLTMTALSSGQSSGNTGMTGSVGFLKVFKLVNPPTGSPFTVSVSFGTLTAGAVCGMGISVTGPVSGESALVAGFAQGVTSGTATVPATTSGNLTVCFVCDGSGGEAITTGTLIAKVDNTGANNNSSAAGNTIGGYNPSATGSTSVAWSMVSDFYGYIAFEIQAGTPGAAVGSLMPQQRSKKNYRHRFGRRGQQMMLHPFPTLPTTPASINGLGGSGNGYFIDQYNQPRMVLGDAAWALCGNAGRWNSGNWQADFDTFLTNRANQGFTVIYTKPMGTTQSGNLNDNGGTFDNLFPFQGGTPSTGVAGANPSTGLTSAFWARIDYLLNSAQNKGITIFLNAIGYSSDFDSGPGPLAGKSAAEFQAYGAALGNRYRSLTNIIWMVADDYFGDNDSLISAFLTGLRSSGDTHPISIENIPESTSRKTLDTGAATTWGAANAQFNFCYSYAPTYVGVEKAFSEASPITPIQGDGYFYQGGSTYAGGSGSFAYDRAIRQDAWHAISSGARGIIHGSESIWQYASSALAASSTDWYYVNNAGNIRTLMESLPNWYLLAPDTSSLLVTAGRGTHASPLASGGGGGQYEVSFTDSYVTASRVSDGSLAVIYMSHASTITIDQTKMAAGYTAKWADPITGTTYTATVGSTYNSGVVDGSKPVSNSQGDPDWVLILQAPAGSITTNGTLSLAVASSFANPLATEGAVVSLTAAAALAEVSVQGSGLGLTAASAFTDVARQLAGLGLASASALSGFTVQGSGTAFGGQATITPTAVQGSSTAFTAASSWVASAVQQAGLSLVSAASAVFSAGSGVAGTIAFAAQSAYTAVANQIAGLSLPGSSALGSSATQGAGTSMSGASSFGPSATQLATAAFTAASTFAAKATQIATTAFGAATALVLNAGGSVTGTIAMAVSAALQTASVQQSFSAFNSAVTFAANAAQQAGLSLPSASAFSAKATQLSTVTLPSAASTVWNAGAAVLGTITMAASSAWQSSAVQNAIAAFPAAGQLTGKAVQGAKATFSGSAALAASVTQTSKTVFGMASSWAGSLFTGTLYGRLKAGGRAIGSLVGKGRIPGNRSGTGKTPGNRVGGED